MKDRFFRVMDMDGRDMGRIMISENGEGYCIIPFFGSAPLRLVEKKEGEPWNREVAKERIAEPKTVLRLVVKGDAA